MNGRVARQLRAETYSNGFGRIVYRLLKKTYNYNKVVKQGRHPDESNPKVETNE